MAISRHRSGAVRYGAAFALVTCLLVTSGCVTVRQIGRINMISNRNVQTQFDYGLLSSYAGGSEKELKKAKAENIEQAIDQTVKRVPGGEFLMNAVIFQIDRKRRHYYAVQGDVWGRSDDLSYRGFKVGDKVTFKRRGDVVSGTISGLKDDQTCYVELSDGEKGVEVRYDALAKGQ